MTANDIRNIALLGHGGSGKTSLAEQMLFMTKGTDRLGRTADGNTTCDYDAEEIKRQISISLAFAPVNYKGVKINVMDAPGNFDFSGEALSAIRAAECAVLVGAAKDGLSVGMERSWKMLGKKPRMIFINRTDEDNSDYASCLDALKGKFGQAIAPIVAPVIDGNKKVTAIVDLLHNTAYEVKGGKAAACAIPADMADEVETLRAELMEAAAGADEELMEKFFDTMELSAQDMAKGLKIGVRDGSVCPVLCGSANTGLGVEMLLQTILEYTRGVQVVPAGTELALRMGLPGVYRMMTKESADGPDVIQGDDFSWTPAAWQGGMAYVDLMRTEGDASGSVGRIWCARARWGGQERWLVYARDGQIALRPTESGSTRLSVVGRGLAFPEDGTYLTAEYVYQTPEMPSPSPLSAELLQFRDEAVKYWARYQENAGGQLTTALDPEKYSQYPIQGGQSVSLEEWDSRFPEGFSPDISGYQERWLFQLEDGRQLLRLDDQLYLLQYHQADGEVFEMLRLRPVPLEPERVLELDRLLLSVSGDDSVAAISFSGAVEAAMRQLPDYRRLLDGGADTLRYCFTMLECRYNGGYGMQAAMMAVCRDILVDMGEDPGDDGYDAQTWYDELKARAFSVSEDLAHHPGYAVLLGLGVSRPDGTAAITYVDMDGDGLAERLTAENGGLRVLRYDGTEVWSSGPVGQNGDEALFLHRNGGQWELLRYGRTAEEQLYELLSLTGGRERLVRSRHLAHGAAAESVRVFAEDFHTLLYGVDEAGLSDGCEMLLLSTMNGETRVGPLYNFSGWTTEEIG